jgi:radical SAM superfamily enzyme YgiQ (UPF0313 family)
MKTLLVATNRERHPYPVAPLGVLCVAAAARAAGHELELLDLGLARQPQRDLARALQTRKFQAVAFGIRNLDNCWAFAPRFYLEETRQLAEITRRHFHGPLILGGSGFSVAPRGWMRRLGADYGIIGEGERTFPELLRRLEEGISLTGMESVLAASKDGSRADAGPVWATRQVNELPPPAHELCCYSAYLRRGGFVSIQTKRGCPFKCSYCVYPLLEGRAYRLRAPEAIVDEIQRVAARGSLHFFFVDSVFNHPPAHALAICRELGRRRLPIQWSAFCNPTGFDAELAHAMKEAGCNGVEFGLDSASDKMLDALRKPFGQREIQTALLAARDARLHFAIYLLFGGPDETWADVKDTQSFLTGCAPANAVFATYGIRVYEGTAIAETACREGQTAPDQDLFEPVYYLSPKLSRNVVQNLDVIARRRPEWSSPADWRRFVTRWGQKITILLNVRPQWKYLRYYGGFMRRQAR